MVPLTPGRPAAGLKQGAYMAFSFRDDYSEGAHPRIIGALARTALEHSDCYGEDRFCLAAADMLRAQAGCGGAEVLFVPGGTQANLLLISHALRPHQAVISAESGHINGHECGAIEGSGHKIIAMLAADGKLTEALVEASLPQGSDAPHVVQPKLVYISQATECGTVYTALELENLARCCRKHGLFLYVDGARMANALAASSGADCGACGACGADSAEPPPSLSEVARLADAFTLGGTKNGLLFGEALVVPNPELARDIRYTQKRLGALLAKGRAIGAQFEEALRDGLYLELAAHANHMAASLRSGLEALGVRFLYESRSNMQFAALPRAAACALKERGYEFHVYGPTATGADDAVCRFVASWATTEEDVGRFVSDYSKAIG